MVVTIAWSDRQTHTHTPFVYAYVTIKILDESYTGYLSE